MNGDNMTPSSNLLTLVYGQCWPNPHMAKAAQIGNWTDPQDGPPKPTAEWVRSQLDRMSAPMRDTQDVVAIPANTVDKSTLKWQTWTAQQTPAENLDNQTTDPTLYRLTQAEFNRLTEQVRDVNANLNNRFIRGVGFKRYYYPKQNESTTYKNNLAASMRAFRPKTWLPYEHEPDSAPTRCRPVSCKTDYKSDKRVTTSRVSTFFSSAQAKARNKSPPASYKPVPVEQRDTFDCLNRTVAFELADGQTSDSFFGEKPTDPEERMKAQKIPNENHENDDASTGQMETASVSNSDESDDETIPEPKVDKSRNVPSLELRPEKLDAIYVREGKGDRRKYDFDAENIEIPPYEFDYPFSDQFKPLDFRSSAMSDVNWRYKVHRRIRDDPLEDQMIDRIMVMERVQIETEEWEQKRRSRRSATIRQNLANKRLVAGRAQSAKITQKDRNCLHDCVQPACVGDCPEKRTSSKLDKDEGCDRCHQIYCTGTCTENTYDSRCRCQQLDESDKQQKNRKTRPRSCVLCRRKHTAKIINAKNEILGRPRSNNATYSQGQFAQKPKDISFSNLENDMHKLELTSSLVPSDRVTSSRIARQRPHTADGVGLQKRLKGRAGMIPHKSYFSQRRNSLTDLTRERIKSIKLKRVRSGKKRRPQTAA